MVGLLGGSFDPIHHAHLIVARIVAEQLGLDSIRFVPARQQPFKQGLHGAAAQHRAAMLRLAIAGTPGFALETAELDRPPPSYTVDTLRALRLREPAAGFTLLLGADAAADLPAWRESDAISSLAQIVVFARPGTAVPSLPQVSRILEVPPLGISATEIRARVRAGRSIRYWVPDPVAEYISAHRLYLGPS